IPFLAAILIPFLTKKTSRIHIGWYVLTVPILLFIALARYIPAIAKGKTFTSTMEWIPSYGIDFTTYLDGLSMIFALLFTGIGSLVVLYSFYYLSIYVFLLLFYIFLFIFYFFIVFIFLYVIYNV